jgi:GNAT superfamily N-acetyltransferase
VEVSYQSDATLAPDEVNGLYATVAWPQRETWRLEAIARSCTWFAARGPDGALVGAARLLDDGGLHASLWDVIVDPTWQRRGIATRLVRMALERCRDRRLLVLVTTPAGRPFFERLGFAAESHRHAALYLRPHRIA